jgi:protein-disulfide isomerase
MAERSTISTQKLGWLLIPGVVLMGAALWFIADPSLRGTSQISGAQSNVPTDEFERRVRAYLLENPEVIVEAMQRFEDRQRAADANEAKSILKSRAEELLRDLASPVGGNPQGDVTLVEFFDYNCPYCRQVAPHMVKAEANDPKLRIVYKEFPILGPNSTFAAKAALAAHRQGKYVGFHRALMETKGTVTESNVLETAEKLGLDLARLKVDMADAAIQAAIDRNLTLAQVLRINGTPGFVIGDQIVPGAVDLATLERLIRESREKE